MKMERTVSVTGEIEGIWQTLLNTLTADRYEIESQNPYTQVSAKRGSKISSAFLEGTKGGYRELNVTVLPKGEKAFEVQFAFDFPSWAMTLSGTKKECLAMLDEFVKLVEGGVVAPAAGGLVCQKCQTSNPPESKYCGSCGAKLEPPASEAEKAAYGGSICPKCKASNPPDASFCGECGEKIEAKAAKEERAVEPEGLTCPKCQASLSPEAKFCSECGAKL